MKVFSPQKDPRVQMHGKVTARIWKNIPTGISTMLIGATRAVKFVFLRRENLHKFVESGKLIIRSGKSMST